MPYADRGFVNRLTRPLVAVVLGFVAVVALGVLGYLQLSDRISSTGGPTTALAVPDSTAPTLSQSGPAVSVGQAPVSDQKVVVEKAVPVVPTTTTTVPFDQKVAGSQVVGGSQSVKGDQVVAGSQSISGRVDAQALAVGGDVVVQGSSATAGDSFIGGRLSVRDFESSTANIGRLATNDAMVSGSLKVAGPAQFSARPSGGEFDQGGLTIDPGSVASPSDTLFGIGVNGEERLRVDASGNVYAKNLILSGSVTNESSTNYNLRVLNDTLLESKLIVSGASTFHNAVTVTGANPFTVASGNASFGGAVTVAGPATFASILDTGNASVGGSFVVSGPSTLSNLSATAASLGSLNVGGLSSFGGVVTVVGATSLGDDLSVSGTTSLVDAVASGQLKLTGNASDVLTLRPTTDPSSPNKVFSIKKADGTEQASLRSDGVLNLVGGSSVGGNATVAGNSSVSGNSTVGGNANVGGVLSATGAANLSSTLDVVGATSLNGGLSVTGSIAGTGTLTIGGTTSLSNLSAAASSLSSLSVSGSSTLTGTVAVGGNSTFAGTVGVAGATTLSNTLSVSGSSTLADLVSSGQVKITGNTADRLLLQPITDPGAPTKVFTIKKADGTEQASLRTDGVLNLAGGASIGGNTSITGSLSITGNTTHTGSTTFTGTTSVSGANPFSVGTGATTLGGTLAVTGNTSLTGNLTSAGSIQGATVNVTSLNTGGIVFAGSGGALTQDNSKLAYDNTNGRLGVGLGSPSATLHVSSSTAAAPLLRVTDATSTSVDVLDIADEGATTFRNRTNSLTGFNVQNAAGTSVIDVDTTNQRVGIGTTSPTDKLQVNGGVTALNYSFANPGIGVDSKFQFNKTNDQAYISVLESSSDLTAYGFYMADNPDSLDQFLWQVNDHQGAGGAWQPLQFQNINANIRAANVNAYGDYNIYGPWYSGVNGAPNTITAVKTGTQNITPDVTGYTGSSAFYWVKIDGVGSPNTFSWGRASSATAGTPIATGVAITGAAQTLADGVTVQFNTTTGGVLNDRWEFRAYKGGRMKTANGTAALPSHSFTNDTDTGMWLGGGNDLRFATSGVDRLTVTASNITASLPLTVNGHLITGGSAPTIAAGAASCTAPTVAVTGNDTAGTVTITTGSGCASTGTMATITYNSAFGAAPRVALTPDNSAASALNYFTTGRSTTAFQVATSTTPTSATQYVFTYHALG